MGSGGRGDFSCPRLLWSRLFELTSNSGSAEFGPEFGFARVRVRAEFGIGRVRGLEFGLSSGFEFAEFAQSSGSRPASSQFGPSSGSRPG